MEGVAATVADGVVGGLIGGGAEELEAALAGAEAAVSEEAALTEAQAGMEGSRPPCPGQTNASVFRPPLQCV